MEASEADMKKRRKLTNGDLLRRYLDKMEATRKRLGRAQLKVLRAAQYLSGVRANLLRLMRQSQATSDAITRGEVYPQRIKKPKRGRRIDL